MIYINIAGLAGGLRAHLNKHVIITPIFHYDGQ